MSEPPDSRERLPGWEKEKGSDELMSQPILECVKRIAEAIERFREHDRDDD